MSKYGPQNSWLFCSLNNIPDGVTACADLVLQTTFRAPINCDLSFRVCKCCLLEIAEHRPARMPVHSELLDHAICMCLALYCSPLGHNLFLPRDIVVTLHRLRAHTTLWSFLMPHCTPVRPRVATPGEMNMHFLPVSPDPSVLPIPTATAHPNLPQLGCITAASSDAVYSSTKSVNTGSAMAANKSVRTVRGPPNTPLLHACGPPCPSRRRQSPLTLLHGQVCIALYARRARVLLSILCSPGHVVEEERIALPLGEATFVSQVLRIGIADAAVGLGMGKSGCAPPQPPRKATCDLSADASHQALARASHFTAAAMRARITGPPSRIRRTRHGERRMNSAPAICGEPKWLIQPRGGIPFSTS